MAESQLTRFERWLAWLFGTSRGQLVFVLSCAGSLALCVWTDGLAREFGRESVLTPTHDDLWRGIMFGAALGLATVISEMILCVPRLLISPWRPVKNWEPSGWRLGVLYVSLGSKFVLALVVNATLARWCTSLKFALFPPFCAMLAVLFLACLLWRVAFGTASQDESATPAEAAK